MVDVDGAAWPAQADQPVPPEATTGAAVIADERDHMQAALHRMRDAFTEACQSGVPWAKAGELQGSFFDGYEQAKRTWGRALLMRDVLGKEYHEIDPVPDEAIRAAAVAAERQRIDRGVLALQDRALRMAEKAPFAALGDSFAAVAESLKAVLAIVRGDS